MRCDDDHVLNKNEHILKKWELISFQKHFIKKYLKKQSMHSHKMSTYIMTSSSLEQRFQTQFTPPPVYFLRPAIFEYFNK